MATVTFGLVNGTTVSAPTQALSLVSQIINSVLTVAGVLFWLDFAILVYYFIESRIHPTPVGRASALGVFVDRAKGMLFSYLGVYLAIFFAVTALNMLGAGLTLSQVLYYFFIQPIANAWGYLTGGKP